MKDHTELLEAARIVHPPTPLERLLDEAFAESSDNRQMQPAIRPIETETQTRPTIRPYGNQTSES